MALKEPGRDGKGVYLIVSPGGSRFRMLRREVNGRRRDIGLDGLLWGGLTDARDEAKRLRKTARRGGWAGREKEEHKPTFEEAVRQVYEVLKPGCRETG